MWSENFEAALEKVKWLRCPKGKGKGRGGRGGASGKARGLARLGDGVSLGDTLLGDGTDPVVSLRIQNLTTIQNTRNIERHPIK